MYTANKIETFHPAYSSGQRPARILLLFCLLPFINMMLTSMGLAATYYVATDGDDDRTKLQVQNISTPWRTINHGVSQLSPGDILLVRGGIYRESVSIVVSGTAGNRIIIQAYPGEEPILDGTKVMTGWTQCTSQADCLGNPNWLNIYKTDVAISNPDFRLHENGNWLPISQWPDQSDPGVEEHLEYKDVPNTSPVAKDRIVDVALDQPDDYWNGAIIKVRPSGTHNYIYSSIVTDFDQASHTIYFNPLKYDIDPSFASYSLLNHIDILDKAGEYYYADLGGGNYRFYLWPNEVSSLANGISVTNIWGSAIGLRKDYITIEGLTMRGFAGGGTSAGIGGSGADSMILRNNEIHDIDGSGIYFQNSNGAIIENNRIYNIGHAFGIHFGGVASSNNIVVKNNTINNTRQTAIYFYPVNNGKIFYNKIEKTGTHGNGITAQGCSNILIAGNKVFTGTRIPCTLSGGSDIALYNNIFSGGYYNTVASWGSNAGELGIFNNVLHGVDGFDGLGVKGDNVVIKNNFIDGGGLSYTDRSHNIFITTSWSQDSMGVGEFIEKDLSKLFLDHNNYDFRHIGGSPAINAGTDITADLPAFLTDPFFSDFDFDVDIDGNPRYSGSGIDIGCYEYISGPPDTTAPSVPQNLTAQAVSESRIDLSWDASNDPESGVSYYKIYRAGSQIDTSVSTSYANIGLNSGTTYSYEVSAVNGQGLESGRSNLAQATTFTDTTPPSIVSVSASETSVEITFSESLDTISAEQISNYSINGVSITAASLDTDTVTLTTSAHTENLTYTLTVVDIQDLAGNPMGQTKIDYQYNQGLVGYWKFDEGNGTTAQDSSGAGNTGTLMNGPVWTTGKVGNALSFDGIDDYVDIGNMNVEGTSLTLAAWFKADSFIASGNRLISKATGSSEQDHYWMLSTISSGGIKLRFRLKTDGTTNTLIATSGDINIDEWIHAAAVYDGGSMILYKDGAEVGTLPKTGTISINSAVPAWIGRNPGGYAPFDGTIDEVHIYNRALTTGEILDLYNEGTTPDTTPPVISNVQSSNVTTSQATITWNTDEASTSQVEYGLDTSYGNSPALDASLVTSHSVLLTGLASETLYHYHVRSKDASGNESIGQDNDFTTVAVSIFYSITASASSGGQISPSGTTQVVSGGSQTYTITQNAGYHISDVLVDGSSVGAVTSYNFTNVTANHNISATFAINTYSIVASAGNDGQISPDGTTQVNWGSTQTYTITPNAGYHISDVVVDGSSVGAVTNYSFISVTADHTIAATFAINTYTITASTGSGGQISPSGTTQVTSGGSQTYTITQNAGYHISDVLVDGSSVGPVTSYSFTNVTADHTIAATFDEQDITAPTATNLSPQADSIQAPLNTLVILGITDSGDGVDASSVVIRVNDNLVYAGDTETYNSADGVCRRAGTKEHYKFAYQAAELFDFDQTMTVTVDAEDLADNPNPITYSYSFETEMRSFGEKKKVGWDSADMARARPVTARDSSGNIWAAWEGGPDGSRDIYISGLAPAAETFSSTVQVTDNDANQCNPTIAIGSDDKIYLAWQDNRRGNWDIYVSTSTDGLKWSAETRVTDSNDKQINPAIAIDGLSPNGAHIVWQDDRAGNQDIYIAASSNGFLTKTVTPITSNGSDQIDPAIAVDYDNTIYVVWTDTRNGSKNDIYGAASNNGPWSNIPIVTKEESQSRPAIATEAVGSILHLLWVDDTYGDDDIFYAQTSGGLTPLTGSSIIDDSNAADQLEPVIAVTGSTGSDLQVFACWQDERNEDADLYFAELSSGNGTNVFVGDNSTNTDQREPAMGIDGDGYPYLVWTNDSNDRTDICYAGSTFIEPDALVSKTINASAGATVGANPDNIDSLDDVCVVIPPGAFWSDVKVTISRINNLPALVPGGFQIGYEIGPSGVEFSTPVTIIIPYEVNGSDNISYTAYWYNSQTGALSQQGITDVEKVVISPSLHALRFKTTHFSQFILGGVAGGVLGGLLGGGGGGCSMSAAGEGTIVEFFLPYIGLTVAMVILKLRDTRKRKARNITKS